MANMTFKASLLPNTDLGYSLGSDDKRWNIYGSLYGDAEKLKNIDGRRVNGSYMFGDGYLRYYLSSGSMTSGYPGVDGFILHGAWDQAGGYDAQLCIGNVGHCYIRSGRGGGDAEAHTQNWTDWFTILDSDNYASITDVRYVTLTTDQNITGTKTWGVSGQGGLLNGAATNGGLNSLRVGDDIWLGDCNASGIMGMKSTSTNCGFYFYNSSGTQIGQLYSNGTNLISNKSIQIAGGNGSGIYFTGTKANYRMIRFIDNTNDNYGNGIAIGGGGPTIIGGGESADAAANSLGTVGNENMWICNDGAIEFYPNLQNGWTTSYRNWIDTSGYYHGIKVYGAVWNDYAECREVKEDIAPGRCVREVGDGTLIPTTARLQRGCNIVSDTFGFAIGETERCKTPIAVSGRVLAYLYENRELARQRIGYGVCSGPDGTVSIMTEEEERMYPNMIVGTISEVPDYEIWHAGSESNSTEIKVDGRIWIKVK